ncbi:response regulator of citrate/malate metabolism [Alkalibacillus flavidus]|uniref:Response regulator of citrate/malate metabolism n=1 Tax=Alkalibacillus flavidus TaxID=546021 RepID=A0ABV2KWN8_9BACI
MSNDTQERLLDKSIKINYSIIKNIHSNNLKQAATKYKDVLQQLESFVEMNREIYDKRTIFYGKVSQLQKLHKSIVGKLTNNETDGLVDQLNHQVLPLYEDLKYYVRERHFHETYGINVFNKMFGSFKVQGLFEQIDHGVWHDVQHYWKGQFGKFIDPMLHLAYHGVHGVSEPRLISQEMFNKVMLPYFNPLTFGNFYSDKNVYDMLITDEHHPDVVLKCVNRQYFDDVNKDLTPQEARDRLHQYEEDLIIKDSKANDGKGVEKLRYLEGQFELEGDVVDFDKLHETFGKDYTIQRMIRQHALMAKPHPESVNTLRMVTLRWNHDIHYLLTYARFGSDGAIKDNGGEGGICVGVRDDGSFLPYGVCNDASIVHEHPTSGVSFAGLDAIPHFDEFISFVKTLHRRILHHNYVSWDIAMGEDGNPIFIEMNFRGPVWKYQLANEKPLFGEMTEEIIQEVQNQK